MLCVIRHLVPNNISTWAWAGCHFGRIIKSIRQSPTFFPQARKAWNTFMKAYPSLPSSNCGNSIKTCTHSVSVLKDGNPSLFGDRQRGEGDFCTILFIFFCLLKRNTDTLFNTKRVGMPNFSGFRATRKITTKSVHTPLFHRALQLLVQISKLM